VRVARVALILVERVGVGWLALDEREVTEELIRDVRVLDALREAVLYVVRARLERDDRDKLNPMSGMNPRSRRILPTDAGAQSRIARIPVMMTRLTFIGSSLRLIAYTHHTHKAAHQEWSAHGSADAGLPRDECS